MDASVTEPDDFSLVLGGPLFQFLRRTRLTGDALQLLHRRIAVLTLLAWAPLLVLSVAEGHAWGGSVALPFLYDAEMHARLLLALPLLVVAEQIVHQRMRPVIRQFRERDLIPDTARTAFDEAIASAMRLRNSTREPDLLRRCEAAEVVKGMRWAPFTLQTVLHLATTTLVPVVPLALTMISLEEQLTRLLKIVF
jgi:hypothetical protein